ncbi:MAG: hypothetical protein A2845_03170 [Candidatus Lloydbacteria bacterium RIFCSPHIGHO2_01_FULL_49_22]|uniref:Uncharacterized protein n=1 Tax=Candidatus Lloydbacteria bacterium RIFCSPHIGHO2_01_FULL_49_22 TaxID=1798658 RepID=A0A1G2CXQ8_9BACT|nr:MAG: hypothetical protein A2845_03170 [Candidatus Lloydbacteria bacterium RIFCSPHIGHO2_01_FULL_49_22]OGZ09881.1 MAG: hypothetical protein A3C14_03005 [Candidatus Lloydbacteria bacterium RIFCSPHIGHO2_02_FULL_50_18]
MCFNAAGVPKVSTHLAEEENDVYFRIRGDFTKQTPLLERDGGGTVIQEKYLGYGYSYNYTTKIPITKPGST